MINHVRTILLQRPGPISPTSDGIHAYVPPYMPPKLPSDVQRGLDLLFRGAVTQTQRSLRANVLVQMLAASPHAPVLTSIDPRVTYVPYSDATAGMSGVMTVLQAMDNHPDTVTAIVGDTDSGAAAYRDAVQDIEWPLRLSGYIAAVVARIEHATSPHTTD